MQRNIKVKSKIIRARELLIRAGELLIRAGELSGVGVWVQFFLPAGCCDSSELTCLVELKELLFEPISLGLLAMSSEPLHPVSALAWSLGAH